MALVWRTDRRQAIRRVLSCQLHSILNAGTQPEVVFALVLNGISPDPSPTESRSVRSLSFAKAQVSSNALTRPHCSLACASAYSQVIGRSESTGFHFMDSSCSLPKFSTQLGWQVEHL